jgi:hypothetical protein
MASADVEMKPVEAAADVEMKEPAPVEAKDVDTLTLEGNHSSRTCCILRLWKNNG